MHRLRLPAALAAPLVLLAGLACDAKVPSGHKAGDLVCLERDSVATLAIRHPAALLAQCPLLVVGVDAKAGMTKVLGPEDTENRFPSSALRRMGKSALPDSLAGATETTVSRMGPSPHPGVLRPLEDFALLFRSKGGTDTLLSEEWPNLLGKGREHRDLQTAFDSLRAAPWYGLLEGAFLPDAQFRVPGGEVWSYAEGSPIRASQAPGAAGLLAVAKPRPVGGEAGDWQLALMRMPGPADSIHQAWVWRTGRGKPKVMRLPEEDPIEIGSVDAVDLDKDSFPDLVVRTTGYYGDGTYSDLHVLHGHPDSTGPGFAMLSLSGSSGEPGGSDVEAEWWSVPPRLYVASAAKGNDNAPEEDRDLRIAAYTYSRSGRLVPVKAKVFHAAVFGAPGPQASADSVAKRLSGVGGKEPLVIKALPRLVKGKLLRQAGAIAPDAATAARWARLDRAGRVLKVKAR